MKIINAAFAIALHSENFRKVTGINCDDQGKLSFCVYPNIQESAIDNAAQYEGIEIIANEAGTLHCHHISNGSIVSCETLEKYMQEIKA